MSTRPGVHVRQAWLQKHPSPAASGGEFHWHPKDRDRELRASCVERLRGIEPPAVLWQLAPGHVAWAQLFAATAPFDRRNYVGVVLTVAEGDGASAAELLDALATPPAGPWTEAAEAGIGPREDLAGPARNAAAIARALLSGGSAIVDDPEASNLPQRIAAVERMLPVAVTKVVRRGVFRAQGIGHAADPVAELIAAALAEGGSRARIAWRILCDLAPSAEAIDRVAGELEDADEAAIRALGEGERRLLGARTGTVDTLHAWGRGRVGNAPDLVDRLARAVTLRILARLVRDRDPGPVLAEVRWHALLPAARREALLAAVAARSPALGEIVASHRLEARRA
ncbi:MAG: hypothetical protein KF773_12525 [Deltaproteobacteria bacterium]|nr:hypothetical protein [Deltaproteobacteria bacterium]